MGTIWVKEFTGGLDTRRLPDTTPGGVLLSAVNGHISRGGEFEKRAAFVPEFVLPNGTKGLAFDRQGLVVFGTASSLAMPAGVRYQSIPFGGRNLTKINSFDLFRGALYLSATYADGDLAHFYNGAQVLDWVDGRAGAIFAVTGGHDTPATVASGKIKVTGGSNGVTNQMTSLAINGVNIIGGNAVQHNGDNNTTAAAVAAAINAFVSVPDYHAISSTNEVTITAVDTGAAVNGQNIVPVLTGDFTTGSMVPMAGGAARNVSTIDIGVNGIAISGDPVEWRTSHTETAKAVASAINDFISSPGYTAVADGVNVAITANDPGVTPNTWPVNFTLTNGFTVTPTTLALAGGTAAVADKFQPGKYVKTVGSKEYATSQSVLHFSGIAQPTKWTTATTGAGFVDMSQEASGSEELTAIAKYQSYIAIFSENTIQIWYVDPDPTLNKSSQVLNNTGTESARSVCQFGDNDIFYLDESGVRSLKARDSSNSASTSDIGVLVDTLVTEVLRDLTADQRDRIFGVIEPNSGRFWLTMGNLVFVFSYFSGAKVSAWSTYIPSVMVGDDEVPFPIEEAVVYRRRVYVRSGNTIYSYGGRNDQPTFDNSEAIGQTPFLDGNVPAKVKDYHGFDIACRGVWTVEAFMDPTNLEALDTLAIVEQSTFPNNRMPMGGRSSHISMRFRTKSAERAVVGSALIHYTVPDGEDDGSR